MIVEHTYTKTINWTSYTYTEVTVIETVDDSTNSSTIRAEVVHRLGSLALDDFGFVSTSPQRVDVYYNNQLISRGIEDRYLTPPVKGDYNLKAYGSSNVNIPHNDDGTVPTGSVKIVYWGTFVAARDSDFSTSKTDPWSRAAWNDGKSPYLYDPSEGKWRDAFNYWTNRQVPTTEITYNLHPTNVYTLTISAGSHSAIKVTRLSSGYKNAPKDEITNGAYIYAGDQIETIFTPAYHYRIAQSKINGLGAPSGTVYTVVGNTRVECSADLFVSYLTAQDTNVGTVSNILVTKYQEIDTHSIRFDFAGHNGYIAADGSIVPEEVSYADTSVPFLIPATFAQYIPAAQFGVCTLTCKSYYSGQPYTRETTFRILIPYDTSNPQISNGSIKDIRNATKNLTSDDGRLVRYQSTAQIAFHIDTRRYAKIASVTVNGQTATVSAGTVSQDGTITSYTGSTDFTNVEKRIFDIVATDSRGYSTKETLTLDVSKWVPYIPLTSNPELSRISQTDDHVYLAISGNWFGRPFDANNNVYNQLTIQYAYRVNSPSSVISSPIECLQGHIFHGASYFRSVVDPSATPPMQPIPIILKDGSTPPVDAVIPYTGEYVFEITVSDLLSTVKRTIILPRGVPVFDWGVEDFNVNVDFNVNGNSNVNGEIRLNSVNIFEYIFPIGSVFLSATAATVQDLPAPVAALERWVLDAGSTPGYYIWVRVDPNANI